MQLYRAGRLKYDKGHNLFPIEDKFHMNVEQIHERMVVFGVAPWENGLPDPEYDDAKIIHALLWRFKVA